jgi:hypothetical protein
MSIGIYSWVHDTATLPYEYKKTFFIIDEDGRPILATNWDYIFKFFTDYLLDTKEYTLIRHSMSPENDDELMGLILQSKVMYSLPTIPAVDIYRLGAQKVAYVDWRMELAVERAMNLQMRFMHVSTNPSTGKSCPMFMGVPLERI